MKIAVSSSHGCGKTTYVYKLANRYKIEYPNKEVGIVSEIARKCPFPINRDSTFKSNLWMISTQIKKELEVNKINDIVICDRSLLDYIAYSYIRDANIFNMLESFLFEYMKSYDKIIYKSINKNNYVKEDGVRDTNLEFREEVDKILRWMYSHFDSSIKRLVVK